MNVRQLELKDFGATLCFSKELLEKFIVGRDKFPNEQIRDEYKSYALTRYEYILKDLYLIGKTHKLFGYFMDDKIVGICGMRLDFGQHYFNDDKIWVLSNLKISSDLSKNNTVLKDITSVVYKEALALGLRQYYTCMAARKRYAAFNRKLSSIVTEYNQYNHEMVIIIPPNTKPDHDAWWSLMGRIVSPVEIVIKKATLIDQ
jgi:hypothetical protein